MDYELSDTTVKDWCSARKSAGFVSRAVTQFEAAIDNNKELNRSLRRHLIARWHKPSDPMIVSVRDEGVH